MTTRGSICTRIMAVSRANKTFITGIKTDWEIQKGFYQLINICLVCKGSAVQGVKVRKFRTKDSGLWLKLRLSQVCTSEMV